MKKLTLLAVVLMLSGLWLIPNMLFSMAGNSSASAWYNIGVFALVIGFALLLFTVFYKNDLFKRKNKEEKKADHTADDSKE